MFRRIISSKLSIAVGIFAFLIGSITGPLVHLPDSNDRVSVIPGRHPAEFYEVRETEETFPWERQQAEVRKFFREFQKAVAANERKKVASMMMYPLRVKYFSDPKAQDYRFLENEAGLLKVYDKVFHSSVKTYIADTDVETIWGNDYFLQTGYGQIGIYVKSHRRMSHVYFRHKSENDREQFDLSRNS